MRGLLTKPDGAVSHQNGSRPESEFIHLLSLHTVLQRKKMGGKNGGGQEGSSEEMRSKQNSWEECGGVIQVGSVTCLRCQGLEVGGA